VYGMNALPSFFLSLFSCLISLEHATGIPPVWGKGWVSQTTERGRERDKRESDGGRSRESEGGPRA